MIYIVCFMDQKLLGKFFYLFRINLFRNERKKMNTEKCVLMHILNNCHYQETSQNYVR